MRQAVRTGHDERVPQSQIAIQGEGYDVRPSRLVANAESNNADQIKHWQDCREADGFKNGKHREQHRLGRNIQRDAGNRQYAIRAKERSKTTTPILQKVCEEIS